MQHYWLLDKNIYFLNHGSYGAAPIPVLEYQQSLRERLERQPLEFVARDLEGLNKAARVELAAFIGADAEDLAFIPNATFGVNTILRSLTFKPGEEILITNHTYNACRNAVEFIANRTGAKVVVAEVPFPVESFEQVTEAILARVSPQTKLALLDHVTSATALIFPIETLVKELANRGVDTLVDGAHAPGFIPLNINKIGAAYYTGNCHKWLFAPKGAGFLQVRPDKQAQIRPLVISHGANSPRTDQSRFRLEFDWMGTDDPTAYLSVPKAIQFIESLLPGGWAELWEHNHQRVLEARKIVAQALEVPLPCPDEMIGAMACISLENLSLLGQDLYNKLLKEFNIEVPIIPWFSGQQYVRISAQVYNTIEQYQYLAEVLSNYLKKTRTRKSS
ncbi:aminotransferase class V-fold PLP-dependent enzyme [Gloeothece verrucosa]|uniref:Aminotransferase class V n=1 Tax=Gloeothece verrucosa (strain PCC 7822) TaxID=497965 RepID=E0UIM2_GLOV7|nr:aminotransferase class V-fold PLP-dependent enzyme [Gloeothece verrucosa]ADN12216.1 aminotransferase class V [Gloeothece verrucosa PCC 7822]